MGIVAPTILDANHIVGPAPTLSLSSDGSTLTMSLAPDSSWLADSSRAFPVTVDPSITTNFSGPYSDCDLYSASPTSSFCGLNPRIHVGYEPGTTDTSNALIRFDGLTGALPCDSVILHAAVGLNVEGADNSTAIPVTISSLTQPWTTSATWNS